MERSGGLELKFDCIVQALSKIEVPHTAVIAGQEITLAEGTLLGHGIAEVPRTDHERVSCGRIDDDMQVSDSDEEGAVCVRYFATMNGHLTSVNSLAYVAPLQARYVPEIGDVVIGRVVEVAQGRWSISINASNLGKLMLTSVALPTGEQRRKTDAEIVDMRRFFSEDDLIMTEVQKVNNDKTCNLHTRNARYGKLYNGCVIAVKGLLIKRLAQHTFVLPGADVYVVLGHNGFVWVGSKPESNSTDTLNFVEHKDNRYAPVTPDIRRRIARVRNAILLLDHLNLMISPDTVLSLYNATNALNIEASAIMDFETNALKILKQSCMS